MLNKYNLFPFAQLIEEGLSRENRYGKYTMPIDVSENEKEYSVVVDVPGINKEDISVEYKDNFLKISVDKKDIKEESNENKYWVMERRYEKRERVIQFGKAVDNENIVAKYENGVLNLSLPKKTIDEKTKIEIL